MTTRTVSNMSEFTAAAGAAVAGDVIALKPGIYTGHLYQVRPAGEVVVTSADPLNKAVFGAFFLNGCHHLTFRGVKADASNQPTAWTLIDCGTCEDVTFDDVEVVGDFMTSKNHCQGISFQKGRRVSVVNSTFRNLLWGVGHVDVDGVTVSKNSFLDIGSVGCRGGGSSNVLITDNEFLGTHPHINPDWHGDGIQLWTNGTTADVENITITGNRIDRGGGTPAQGIFLGQQAGYPFRYRNVTIADNIINGCIYGGVSVTALDDFSILRNTVQGYADQESWLYWLDCTNGVVADNKATRLSPDAKNGPGITVKNNRMIAPIAPPSASPAPAPAPPVPVQPIKQPTNSQRSTWLARAKTIQSKARELQALAAPVVAATHPIVALTDGQASDADALVKALGDGALAMWKK